MPVGALGLPAEKVEAKLFLRAELDLARDAIVILGVELGEFVARFKYRYREATRARRNARYAERR